VEKEHADKKNREFGKTHGLLFFHPQLNHLASQTEFKNKIPKQEFQNRKADRTENMKEKRN